MNKPNVIFIVGYGRSGSTILDRLLGSIEGFQSAGELKYIWRRGLEQNQLCGCGEKFSDCSFWSNVIETLFCGTTEYSLDRLKLISQSAYNWHHLLNIYQFDNPAEGYQQSQKDFIELWNDLYQAIKVSSGASYIIDSSKDPLHAFLLSTSTQIKSFIVHLVRDSRAAAFSRYRKKERPEIHWNQQTMPVRSPFHSIRRWNKQNQNIEFLKTKVPNYFFLRYEDLATNPSKVLSKLLKEMAIVPIPNLKFINGNRVNLKTSHTVSGNPMRFQSGETLIQIDQEWRSTMNPLARWLVTIRTQRLLKAYGYIA